MRAVVRPAAAASPIALVALVPLALVTASCDITFSVCDDVDREALHALPATLSQTGLYADIGSGEIASDAILYRPQFELWSDGAEKRRWFRVPPGTQIDTSDQNDWQFPVGTAVFKEFASQTRPLETRLLMRTGPGVRDGLGVSYVWQADGSDAIARADGAVAAPSFYRPQRRAPRCQFCATECSRFQTQLRAGTTKNSSLQESWRSREDTRRSCATGTTDSCLQSRPLY